MKKSYEKDLVKVFQEMFNFKLIISWKSHIM